MFFMSGINFLQPLKLLIFPRQKNTHFFSASPLAIFSSYMIQSFWCYIFAVFAMGFVSQVIALEDSENSEPIEPISKKKAFSILSIFSIIYIFWPNNALCTGEPGVPKIVNLCIFTIHKTLGNLECKNYNSIYKACQKLADCNFKNCKFSGTGHFTSKNGAKPHEDNFRFFQLPKPISSDPKYSGITQGLAFWEQPVNLDLKNLDKSQDPCPENCKAIIGATNEITFQKNNILKDSPIPPLDEENAL